MIARGNAICWSTTALFRDHFFVLQVCVIDNIYDVK